VKLTRLLVMIIFVSFTVEK